MGAALGDPLQFPSDVSCALPSLIRIFRQALLHHALKRRRCEGLYGLADTADGFGGGMGGAFGRRGRGGGRARPAPPAEAYETEVSIPFITAALGGSIDLRIDGRDLTVKIPTGMEEGKKLRLHGQAPGGGNLEVLIHIQPHPYFRREGNNIILEVPLTLAEAVLGTKVDVPTLDGTHLSVKIPPGASSGTRLRLRNRGIKGGDQYIEVKVVVPAPRDTRSKELIEEFARLNPQNPRAGLGWT